MNDEDYRFLHGLPTLHCGSWLSSKNHSSCRQPECALFQDRTRKMRSKSATEWFAEMRASKNKYECNHCTHERKRRHRVLWGESLATRKSVQEYNMCAHLHDDLRSERFKEALYIQMTKETVGKYAFSNARFLRSRRVRNCCGSKQKTTSMTHILQI